MTYTYTSADASAFRLEHREMAQMLASTSDTDIPADEPELIAELDKAARRGDFCVTARDKNKQLVGFVFGTKTERLIQGAEYLPAKIWLAQNRIPFQTLGTPHFLCVHLGRILSDSKSAPEPVAAELLRLVGTSGPYSDILDMYYDEVVTPPGIDLQKKGVVSQPRGVNMTLRSLDDE